MKTVAKPEFTVVGIKVRTSNATGQAATDIGGLWQRFMSEGIAKKIPHKVDQEVLAIYTNYEGDHMMPYDMILGCRVSRIDELPTGLISQSFQSGNYVPFVSKGDLTKDAVYNTWMDIWQSDLDRTYIADFEVYGEKSQNPKDGEIEIFVGVK